jgi:hypothetical protein
MGAGHINPVVIKGERYEHHDDDDDDDEDEDREGTLKNSAFDPGLVYDAGFLDYLGFLCDAAPEAFSDPAGTCAGLTAAGIPTDASDLNLASIGIAELAGSQTVIRTVTADFGNRFDDDDDDNRSKKNKNRRRVVFRPRIEAPPGYEVTVSPKKLKLRNGETATFTVTITNVDAPIGEWRFGSLTWKGGGYDVYSPIAVRGQLFNAPAAISGSGESGAASFGVSFGYTGAYTAGSHGLEPAAVTSANVLQDPDQTFNPGDGYSNLHQFSLSGAALFRVAIPPEATEADADLDVFVFDPSGAFVTSSTNGGTDELIDILLPADGTWSVYVHGWAAPGGDSDYDMYSWAISATPGGNLALDSAPASATIGALETIDLSWAGAAVGSWHLGAVSHTGDAGLMGLTLIEVDNR